MKKIVIMLLAVTLANTPSVAQEKLSALSILDRTSERMLTPGGISANFTTTMFQGTQPQETISGTIDILGEKYVMKTPGISTWFNGTDQWSLIAGNGEVTLSSPTPEELQASSPMAFIGIYKQGFNLSYKKAELRGRKVWDVSLKPKKRGQEPSVIIISIDSKTFDPMCIRIRNKKDWTRISINDFKSGAGLPVGHFNYPANEHPEYEIIDMR